MYPTGNVSMLFASAEMKAVQSKAVIVWLPAFVPTSKKNADDKKVSNIAVYIVIALSVCVYTIASWLQRKNSARNGFDVTTSINKRNEASRGENQPRRIASNLG